MLRIPTNPSRSENQRRSPCRGTDLPCVVCGKAVKIASKNARWLHLWDGAYAVTEEEAEQLSHDPTMAGGDTGAYPVGTDCLRQHPELKLYIQR